MKAERFISSRLKFDGKIPVYAVALSFFVIIVAVAVSSGFRKEIRSGLSSMGGDVQLTSRDMNYMDQDNPICVPDTLLSRIMMIPGVERTVPVVYRAGIVKTADEVQGVVFKGTDTFPDTSSVPSAVIPGRLSRMLGLGVGDPLTAYFVGEKVKVRRFTVSEVSEDPVQTDDVLLVRTSLGVLQRLNDWEEEQISACEVILDDAYRTPAMMNRIASEIGFLSIECANTGEAPLLSRSSADRFHRIFDWLDLIDYNVIIILILMTIVAGFNMISGLLILLFRDISVIGTLKSLGMTDRGISKVFLRLSSEVVLKGMAIGNALAIIFCVLQSQTHFLRLNPANYFVPFVPVSVSVPFVLLADVVSYVVIMLLLLIPCLFISKVDPSVTVSRR